MSFKYPELCEKHKKNIISQKTLENNDPGKLYKLIYYIHIKKYKRNVLILKNYKINKDEFNDLCDALNQNQHIKYLAFDNCFLNNEHTKILAKLKYITNIYLPNNAIKYEGVKQLLSNKNFVVINLHNNHADCIPHEIFNHPKLKFINLSANILNLSIDDEIKSVYLKNKTLKEIDLTKNNIPSKDWIKHSTLLKNKTNHLYIQNELITPKDFKNLLKEYPKLRGLSITLTHFDKKLFTYLSFQSNLINANIEINQYKKNNNTKLKFFAEFLTRHNKDFDHIIKLAMLTTWFLKNNFNEIHVYHHIAEYLPQIEKNHVAKGIANMLLEKLIWCNVSATLFKHKVKMDKKFKLCGKPSNSSHAKWHRSIFYSALKKNKKLKSNGVVKFFKPKTDWLKKTLNNTNIMLKLAGLT